MITTIEGDILTSPAQMLVNPVSCDGGCGSTGLANLFKRQFPNNDKLLQKACGLNMLQPGKIFIYPVTQNDRTIYIANFPTRRFKSAKSLVPDIERGLISLRSQIEQLSITSVAIPALGCGAGGLGWMAVLPLIKTILAPLKRVKIEVYLPHEK